MLQQSPTGSAKVFDFAVHRMQKIARDRLASGTKRRFLWVHPTAGSMQAVEFPTKRQNVPSISALAR